MTSGEAEAEPVEDGATALLPDVPRTNGRAEEVAFPPRERYYELVAAYREAGFEMCADVCAVDYLTHPGRQLPEGVLAERFEVVVNLLSLSMKRRVRVRVQVPEADPVVRSITDLYPGTRPWSVRCST